LLELSELFEAVFLVDQAEELDKITTRLNLLAETIKNFDVEEISLFTSWV